jgi:hypothetical protein
MKEVKEFEVDKVKLKEFDTGLKCAVLIDKSRKTRARISFVVDSFAPALTALEHHKNNPVFNEVTE